MTFWYYFVRFIDTGLRIFDRYRLKHVQSAANCVKCVTFVYSSNKTNAHSPLQSNISLI